MIRLLDDLSLIEGLSSAEPYFACLFMADGAALLPQPELMNIWVELDESGRPASAVRVDSEEITLLCGETPPGAEMVFFISKLVGGGTKRIICGEKALLLLKKLFPAREEALCLMRCLSPLDPAPCEFEIKTNSNLESVFALLESADCASQNPQSELWMLKMRRGIAKGQVTVLSAESGGGAVSTAAVRGRTKSAGAVASVATSPCYRGRGFASALTFACSKLLLSEHREPWLAAAAENAQRLYERLGFTAAGKCFILHLDEKEDRHE